MDTVTAGAMAGKEVICVEYPGVVQNTEAMLDTLGGTLNLCKVFTDKSRRMELRYAHPATSRPFLVDSQIFIAFCIVSRTALLLWTEMNLFGAERMGPIIPKVNVALGAFLKE